MNTFMLRALALYAICLGLASCGGGGGAAGQFEFTGDPDRFTLNVLDESGLGEELSGEFEMRRHDEGDEIVLEVEVRSGFDLRALYLEVEYNPNRYTPVSAERSRLLGSVGVLELAVLDVPGRLSHGQLLAKPQEKSGFSGDGVLASLRFRQEPFGQARSLAEAPADLASQAMPSFDNVSGELSWFYRSTGDYDQNGEVTISDLTPLGVNFGASETGGFDDATVLSVVDGDGNGQINISDITPIGIGFGRSNNGGFNIYRSSAATDYPADPLDGNGAGAVLLGNHPFSEAIGNTTVDRLSFSYIVSDPEVLGFYWLRPVDGSGSEGYSSALVSPPDENLPKLSIPLPPASGGGTLADPYLVDPDEQVQFLLENADSLDLTTDPLSSFSVLPAEAGSFGESDGLLTVATGFEGSFSVSASYNGLSAPQVFRFEVRLAGPTAVLTASRQFGVVPLNITFSGSESSAPAGDGFITQYSFDWENDGTVDEVSTSAGKSNTFSEPGLYEVRLQVLDNKDRVAETTIFVEAYLPGGPNAALNADPLSGREPINVNFDASTSTPFAGTSIDRYEFDFNDDFDFSDVVNTSGLISQLFETAGLYPVRVKVFGDDGLFSIAERKITVNVNTPPTAVLNVGQMPPFYLPLTLNFDASASTDIDGGIVGYKFDFDGDGSFDYEGTETSQDHTYTEAGAYTVTLAVQDVGGKTGMDTFEFEVFVDDRPVADLLADVTTGLEPLTVNFDATGSMDPENMLVSYEWDLNGDGDFSDLVEETGVVQHVYISKGTFNASVRVTDADDNSDEATVQIVVSENMAPNADVRADKVGGFTPITIEFDGSNSSDSDGTVELYEWDIDGDDDFDDGYGNVDMISIEWTDTGGMFTIKLRVTDDKGKSSNDSVTVTVNNNEPPVADLQADSTSGFRPLPINFDGTGSMDTDGTIVNYRWDFDYDAPTPNFVLEGLEDSPSYIFDQAGEFDVLLRVVDDGGKSGDAIVTITVMENADPVADLLADSMTFDLVVATPIEFDAGASFDPDGGDTILADFDFDGNGTYEVQNQDVSILQQYAGWSLPGMYLATVRVRDNHGAEGFATVPITVTGGQPAPTVVLNSPLTAGEAPLGVYFDADGSDTNGVIEKYEFDTDGPLNGWNWQESGKTDKATARYDNTGLYEAWVRVTDDDGAYGLASIPVIVSDQYDFRVLDPDVGISEWMAAAVVDGRPAVAYASGTSELRFVIANDSSGLNWQDPQIINTDKCTRISLVEMGSGRAGISYYDSTNGLKFLRADDSTNSTWTAPVIVEASADNKDIRMVMCNGNPAVAYFVGTNLKFKRCGDPNGDLPTSWPVSAVTVDTSASQPLDLQMINIFPTLLYRDGFSQADDQFGANWSTLHSTGINGGTYYSLVDVGNQPRFVHDQSGYNFRGSDDSGASWTTAVSIMPGNTVGKYSDLLYDGDLHTSHSMTISASNYTVPITRQLVFHQSFNLGAAWSAPYGLDTLAEQGVGISVLAVNGLQGVAYRGTHNGTARILKWQVAIP